MVGCEIIRHDIGADSDHRVGGRAADPTAGGWWSEKWGGGGRPPPDHPTVPVSSENYAASAPASAPLAFTCRFTADSTDLNDAVTILLSIPTPNSVGPFPTRSST